MKTGIMLCISLLSSYILLGQDKIVLQKAHKLEVMIESVSTHPSLETEFFVLNHYAYEVLDEDAESYHLKGKLLDQKVGMKDIGDEEYEDLGPDESEGTESSQDDEQYLKEEYKFSIHKKTAIVVNTDTNTESRNEDIVDHINLMIEGLGYAFFPQIAGKKTGDSWTVEEEMNGIVIQTTYTFKKSENNMATLSYHETQKGTTTEEYFGKSITATVDAKGDGVLTVDLKNFQIKNRDIEMTQHISLPGESSSEGSTSTSNKKITVK